MLLPLRLGGIIFCPNLHRLDLIQILFKDVLGNGRLEAVQGICLLLAASSNTVKAHDIKMDSYIVIGENSIIAIA